MKTTVDQQEWAAELRELDTRRRFALELGGADAIARLHAQGKHTARERIDRLLDANSFVEFGQHAGNATYSANGSLASVTPSTSIIGVGTVGQRRTVVAADDFTIRGGSSEAAVSEKWIYADRYALEHKLPIVRLIDSAGGSVKLLDKMGYTKIPGYSLMPLTKLLGVVPVVGIALGACAGLAALRVGASHLSIMVREKSQVFAGGPPVVKQAFGIEVDKENLGGYDKIHRKSGLVNMAADSEEEAIDLARRFLSYLPQNVWSQTPRIDTGDSPRRSDPWLNNAIPRDARKVFNPHRILESIFDHGTLFEISPHWGGSTITCLARLDGHAVGVMINNPRVAGGALTRAAAKKLTRFIDLCDTFHLPLVNLVDQPGVMTGPQAELDGTLAEAMQALHAIEQSSVPWIAIVLRRCVGLAGAMLSPWYGPDGTSIPHRFAWPSARWGSIPIEGGVAAAYKREISEADDPMKKRMEIESHYQTLASPMRTAERFGVIDIIEPARTRPLLCDWIGDAYRTAGLSPQPKARTMR